MFELVYESVKAYVFPAIIASMVTFIMAYLLVKYVGRPIKKKA